MKRKSFVNFWLIRLLACVLAALVVFTIVVSGWKDKYDSAISEGFDFLGDRYEQVLRTVDQGRHDYTFVDIFSNIYTTDYVRIAKVNDDGSFEDLYETRYDVYPIEHGGAREWIYITDNEELLAQGSASTNARTGEWTISYKKCDEINKMDRVENRGTSNSWLLVGLTKSYLYDYLFAGAAAFCGTTQFNAPLIQTYYIDGDTYHIGKVVVVDSNLNEKGLSVKSWDFTDPSKADLYASYGANLDIGGSVYPRVARPDEFLDEQKLLLRANSISDLEAYVEEPGRLSNPLVEEKFLYGRIAADHTMTQGAVKLLVIEGNRYILEYVVKTASFEDYFMPALIILALVLLILAVGISLLTALIPYNQYKKAYENNVYKNNLIDSLAHNMKTPLQILGGYAENLKDVEDVSEKNVYADRILEKTFEMNKDIEAILKTAERNDRKYVSASVRKCVGEVAEKLNAKVTITGDMTLKMDEEYFKTALFCLIDNAEKYKIADSEVVVDINSNEFTVTNMAEASKFTPGTGLAIAGRIFEQHKLHLNTSLKDGVFVVRAGKKPIA